MVNGEEEDPEHLGHHTSKSGQKKNYIEAVRLTSNKYDWRIIALNPLQEDET